MGIIVLAEMRAAYAPSMASDYVPDGKLKAIHAAASDASIPEDPVEETLCGKSTAEMQKVGYQPSGPGATWYPQNLEQRRCRACNEALHAA